MEKFKVAHFREQGQDIIIVLVSSSFGMKSNTEQEDICAWLQECASSAALAGTVVPVWDNGGGRMGFRAPHQWHPFFKNLSLRLVAQNVNKTLTCS